MANHPAPLTDLINAEPSIFRGMNVTEAKYITLASVIVFLLIGVLLFAATGFWQFIPALGFFGPLVTLWLGSGWLATLKRGRPDGYYAQGIHLWMVRRGLAKPRFISHDGYWELGQTLDFGLASPFEHPFHCPRDPVNEPPETTDAAAMAADTDNTIKD